MSQIDPSHEEKRKALQGLGLGLLGVGGILALIGMIDFLSAFGSRSEPALFGLLVVGAPMVGIGAKLAGFGYMREITRYGAGEVAPVAKDALEYLRRPDASEAELVGCASCRTHNRPDASFCDNCGKPLGVACGSCGSRNDAGARFCDACGAALAPAS